MALFIAYYRCGKLIHLTKDYISSTIGLRQSHLPIRGALPQETTAPIPMRNTA
jgi:hypothetical protein